MELLVADEKKGSGRGKTPRGKDEAPGEAGQGEDREVTTMKVFRRIARTLNKLAALLDVSQPEALALFEREIENRLSTELEKAQKQLRRNRPE